ncbi:LamB/YcsF family protein [Blastococcus sp. TF02A-30]|nr:LamB/YcsF family protein [Blastococcus sp. TF02A-30]
MPVPAPRGARPFRCETAAVTTSGTGRIDLNADLGEGFGVWRLGDDDALLGVVSSANVACGFHAGDPSTMRRVCAGAAAAGVAVGAQVSYRDLAGFGRRFVDVAPAELADDVLYQLAALDGVARATGTRVRYVKPHGALYNAVVAHEEQARAVVDAVVAYDPALPVLGLPGSALLRAAAAAGLRTVPEGFADRGYTAAGTLVPRREPGALVTDPAAVAERAVRMAAEGAVVAVDGGTVPVAVESVCVHGDTPGAVALARAVRTALEDAGLAVTPFTG